MDEDDKALKEKQKADEAALKAARDKGTDNPAVKTRTFLIAISLGVMMKTQLPKVRTNLIAMLPRR